MLFFSKIAGRNVFTSILSFLDVKYTENFSQKYFNEHPHKNNLLGLSKMLSDYGIENAGTKIKDRDNDLFNIETPFVAFTGDDFVTVYKVSSENVSYMWNGKNISVSPTEFIQQWTGIVLLAEANEDSIEPNYKENKKKEVFNSVQKSLLLLTICATIILAFVVNSSFNNLGLGIVGVLNLVGISVGYLLVQKQMHTQSEYVDKICSLFKQGDCNDVLESSAANFLGVIGWSEIGFGYFMSNVFIIAFFPWLVSYLAVINICALPYSFWSVWYQKVKAKQWCPLCLIVQSLLWVVFIANLIFGFIQIPNFNIENILVVGCIYLIPLLAINIIIPKLSDGERMEQITQEINSIKADEDIFCNLLKKQPQYEVDKSTSHIILGNQDANILITVFTNPHCNPCAKMHSRIEELLTQTDKLCIQYIFSSFDESLDLSNKFLTAIYLNNSSEKTKGIYAEWFEKGKSAKEEFFKKYQVNYNNKNVEQEFEKHKLWKENTGLRATPTILVNGYKLPDNYKIEDLKYFTNLEIDSK